MDVKLCRLCANKKDSFVGIYDDEGHKLRIEFKINKCLQIEMYPEDPLPKTVCLDCCAKLEQSFRFLESSHVAQLSLHRLYPIGEEGCQTSDLKEEETLVELLPLSTNNHHQVPDLNHCILTNNVEEKHEDNINEVVIEDEEEHHDEDDEDYTPHESLEDAIEEVIEIDNDENEPGIRLKKKQLYIGGRKQKRVEELSELEVEELMMKDEQWQQYPWICADCSQELPSVEQLREHHRLVHKQNPHYMCAQCSKVCSQFQLFFSHIKRHRNLLKYSCEECGKSFSTKRVLDSHSASHSNMRPYVCQECGKAFRQQNALFIHTRCHLPDNIKNKYLCDLCNKGFSTRPNLMTHKRIHTGVRNYTCEQCGKSFIQKGNLDAHMLTHTQDKPFNCDMCNKGFKTAMQLKKHQSVHTGAKPHQCEVCGRSFRERGTLREHLRIHTGAMPFTCEYCGKTFRFKGILTTHRRQHTGERPYSCVECQHHFTNWPNYNKHMKRRHGINTSRQIRPKALPQPQPEAALEPPPLYDDYPPAIATLPPATTYHTHPNSFPNPSTGIQQFFTFTQLPGQPHLDPALDMLQHR